MRLAQHFALATLACLIPLVGLAQSDEDVDADTSTTFDGLVQVKARGFRNVWLKPGVDPSRYTKILPGGAQFHYRDVEPVSGTTLARSRATEFPIEETNRARVEEAVVEAFREALADIDNFTVADQPGPDTVLIWGGLHDIVSRVPPEYAGRSEVYLRSVGEATLVIQMEDSMTREVIARIIDRRAAEPAFPTRSSPVTNLAEVRRLAGAWARAFRSAIEKWHESEPLPLD
jgi:Protein of unknown function (DUF3313)